MKRTRYETVSSIQETVTRDLKGIQEEVSSLAFHVNIVPKLEGTILNDDINKYFYHFCIFYGLSLGTYLSHYIE